MLLGLASGRESKAGHAGGRRPGLERRPRPRRRRGGRGSVRKKRPRHPERPVTRPVPTPGRLALELRASLHGPDRPAHRREGRRRRDLRAGNRRSSRCDAPGIRARATFRVRQGKIVRWSQSRSGRRRGGPDLGRCTRSSASSSAWTCRSCLHRSGRGTRSSSLRPSAARAASARSGRLSAARLSREQWARLRALTDRPFAINHTGRPFDPDVFDAILRRHRQ